MPFDFFRYEHSYSIHRPSSPRKERSSGGGRSQDSCSCRFLDSINAGCAQTDKRKAFFTGTWWYSETISMWNEIFCCIKDARFAVCSQWKTAYFNWQCDFWNVYYRFVALRWSIAMAARVNSIKFVKERGKKNIIKFNFCVLPWRGGCQIPSQSPSKFIW